MNKETKKARHNNYMVKKYREKCFLKCSIKLCIVQFFSKLAGFFPLSEQVVGIFCQLKINRS